MECIRFMKLKKLKQKEFADDTLNDPHSQASCERVDFIFQFPNGMQTIFGLCVFFFTWHFILVFCLICLVKKMESVTFKGPGTKYRELVYCFVFRLSVHRAQFVRIFALEIKIFFSFQIRTFCKRNCWPDLVWRWHTSEKLKCIIAITSDAIF